MRSRLELSLDKKILNRLTGLPLKTAQILVEDEEIHQLQDYANTVSIKRLRYNDHGPVHMRKVTLNAVIMTELLHEAGVKLNLEQEQVGTFEDSVISILMATFLHDIGMTVGRDGHENMAITLAYPIADRILGRVYGNNLAKRIITRSMAMEGILGHMTTHKIHSLEAGIVLIADGCDMEKGRARIPLMLSTESKVGDIHKYSATSIKKVSIARGSQLPIKITVNMTESVGFFQIEEVLLQKIAASPIKPYIELYAGIDQETMKRYL